MKGLKWHVKNEITRIRKYNDTYQKSTLDQIFSNNDILVNSFDIRAPLGKSDHLCFSIELKLENDPEYISCSKKNWYKVDKKFVLELSGISDVYEVFGKIVNTCQIVDKCAGGWSRWLKNSYP